MLQFKLSGAAGKSNKSGETPHVVRGLRNAGNPLLSVEHTGLLSFPVHIRPQATAHDCDTSSTGLVQTRAHSPQAERVVLYEVCT